MQWLIDQPRLRTLPPYVVHADAFSAAECNRLEAVQREAGSADATVGRIAQTSATRISAVAWLHPSRELRWLWQRLAAIVRDARASFYHFHVAGFWEPLQLARYTAEQNGHYGPHKDIGPGTASARKLSLVTLLTDRRAFTGGDLLMHGKASADKTVHELTRGSVVIFPSWELHEVTPVTRGERTSLVAWAAGPPFA